MKLPKSYIKKYGGINKKAWAAYKSTLKGTGKKRRSSSKSKKKGRGSTARSGGIMGGLNFGGGIGKGIAVGVAAGVINRFIPVNIAGADLIIAGVLMKDSTVQKIGAITLGRNLASSFTGLGLGQGGVSGGGF